MPDEQMPWKLLSFPKAIDEWAKRESPNDDLRLLVLDWAMGRRDEPYPGDAA